MTSTAAAPNFDDVLRAAEAVAHYLAVTPAWSYPLLDEVAGVRVVVKHENTQPVGAFKIRGGLTLLAGMSDEERRRGLVTASTGNHAQSVAYAARRYDAPATIVMPESAPVGKVDAVRALGATVVIEGRHMGEAGVRAAELAAETGARHVSPGDDPAIVAGHATVYLELFRQHPDLLRVYVPVGSGSGAAGACIVRDALAPDCAIVGVQSAQAPAAHRAWQSGSPATAPCETRVSGLATDRSFGIPQSVLATGLADFLLVDDGAIDDARRVYASHAHTLAEGAGAAALAGLLAHRPSDGPVAVVCTGGNADTAEIATLGTV